MVKDGFAAASYGLQYHTDEIKARVSRLGIWQGSCEAPAQSRQDHHIGRQR